MRTTLDIDNDVLMAVREIAAKEKKTAGKILSEFTRRGMLSGDATPASQKPGEPYAMKNGVPILPSRGDVVSVGHIQSIMEDEEI